MVSQILVDVLASLNGLSALPIIGPLIVQIVALSFNLAIAILNIFNL
ncbi:hypothetical protein ACFL1X_00115 [Candidatus Hydrogenedentota bacterium]